MEENITASLSDHAAVNHCVTESLRETMHSDIVELHCDVHPLDALANKARATLKERGPKGQVYGKD